MRATILVGQWAGRGYPNVRRGRCPEYIRLDAWLPWEETRPGSVICEMRVCWVSAALLR